MGPEKGAVWGTGASLDSDRETMIGGCRDAIADLRWTVADGRGVPIVPASVKKTQKGPAAGSIGAKLLHSFGGPDSWRGTEQGPGWGPEWGYQLHVHR